MRAIHFLLGLLLFLGIAAAGLVLIVSPAYPECLKLAVGFGASLPPWVRVVAGVLVLGYLFIYLLSGVAWRRRRTFITFENENGQINVSADAVRDYLGGLKTEFAAVVWLKSLLRVHRGALEVGLILGVRDGTRIPELCKLMQARVRELLAEHLGTCDLAGVSIEVNEIQRRKKSTPDSAVP
ncbi:MAG TPA: hypothetical protein PLD40_01280 [Kiritimatiellia bacterium]|jgi:uncharacterized alkaline shock family protein YloU|nr:MAG: hypothetical protein BWX54_01912 [Verrucomicrobia bacterium ADurb.Bin018]HOD99463.1 hypothetical protein [Kiritimatiellia bacterium]HOE36050.1 hypothetical protein [Kiritimatiellia bacterium]HOR73474.1 hypothetical protein [Kiritimatiellia bacterium]HOU58136.1 hypothetical protein [Kiritimatiellia bacterium]